MNHIFVELDMLESVQKRMQEKSDHYQQLYHRLYATVDDTQQYWSGKEQEVFLQQIHEFEQDFNKLHQLLNEYCSFLKKSAQAYRSCQDEATSMAYRLFK